MTHQKQKNRESKQKAMGMIALKGRKELEWRRQARLKNAGMRLQEASIRNRTKRPVRSFFRDCLARIAKTIGWNRS